MSFLAFARAHGLVIEDLHASDRIRRCATEEHPHKKNGAYLWDGTRGWVFCWDGEAKTHWYADPNAKPWSEEEKRAWHAGASRWRCSSWCWPRPARWPSRSR